MHLGSLLKDQIPQKARADRAAAERARRVEQDFHIPSWQPHAFSPHNAPKFSLCSSEFPAHPAGSERAGDCEAQPQPRCSGCCFSKLPQGASISEGYRAGSQAVAEPSRAGPGAGAHPLCPTGPPPALPSCHGAPVPPRGPWSVGGKRWGRWRKRLRGEADTAGDGGWLASFGVRGGDQPIAARPRRMPVSPGARRGTLLAPSSAAPPAGLGAASFCPQRKRRPSPGPCRPCCWSSSSASAGTLQ